jgi:hypothetical protein
MCVVADSLIRVLPPYDWLHTGGCDVVISWRQREVVVDLVSVKRFGDLLLVGLAVVAGRT